MLIRVNHLKPPAYFLSVLIALYIRSPEVDGLILQRLVEAEDVIYFKVQFAGCRLARKGEADADLIPVQDGEVLGRVCRPTKRLGEAELLRVELDRAPQIGNGDSWVIAVESNHRCPPAASSSLLRA